MQAMANVLLGLDRYQEAHETATESVAFAKAHHGQEDPRTLRSMYTYAVACAKLGRVEEAKANFEAVLATETRIFGRVTRIHKVPDELIRLRSALRMKNDEPP